MSIIKNIIVPIHHNLQMIIIFQTLCTAKERGGKRMEGRGRRIMLVKKGGGQKFVVNFLFLFFYFKGWDKESGKKRRECAFASTIQTQCSVFHYREVQAGIKMSDMQVKLSFFVRF